LISAIALITSIEGLFCPGLRPPRGETNCRYFRFLGGEQLKKQVNSIFHTARE
jgi:hypothetical protein